MTSHELHTQKLCCIYWYLYLGLIPASQEFHKSGQEIPELTRMGNAQSINVVLLNPLTITVTFRASTCSLLQNFPKYHDPNRRMHEFASSVNSPLIGVGNAQSTGFIKTPHPIPLPMSHMQQKSIASSLIPFRVRCISISRPKSGAGQIFVHPISQKRHSMLFLTHKWRNERLGEYSNLSWSVSDPKVFLYSHEHRLSSWPAHEGHE